MANCEKRENRVLIGKVKEESVKEGSGCGHSMRRWVCELMSLSCMLIICAHIPGVHCRTGSQIAPMGGSG